MRKTQALMLTVMTVLLWFPCSMEAKKKRNDSENPRHEKIRNAQDSIDLSGYGIIDDSCRLKLQLQLQQLIRNHNLRLRTKKSKIKHYSQSNSPDDTGKRKTTYVNFNILDLGKYELIGEAEQKELEQKLNELIAEHNIYASGTIRRPGSIRFRK